MGYDLHITRKADWFDEDGEAITLQQWIEYVHSDPKMRLDNFAQATTSDGEVTIRMEEESIAVWTEWEGNEADGNMAWFYYDDGNVAVKNPDQDIRRKMYQIAVALEAKVQGDDGETYNAQGNQELLEDQEIKTYSRPWWKFW